ncbi:MAG: FkbM family methyltransferase [Chitinophagaceae bacterium]|nr:MAG: FkbM family methyltransferase [Chitinophagaceae bacterium]
MNSLLRTFRFFNSHPIAKRNKFSAYQRFLWWQLRSRLNENKLFIIPFVDGTRFFAKRRLTGITGSIYTGLQDFEEMSFLLHFLRKEDCFFDVGSNVGAYSILASGVRGSKTLAFEPNSQTFSLLRKNISLNSLDNIVHCENKAVGSKHGKLNFTVDGDTTNHVISEEEVSLPSIEVPIVPLDDYAAKHQPAIMKIDVEGFETEVICGAQSILDQQNLKVILIELNGSGGRYGFDESEIHKKLQNLCFEPYTYDPFSRSLKKENTFGQFNTLYIRDVDFVINRIKGSQPFRIWNMTI